MSNLGIAGFDVYKKDNCMGCKTPTRKDLEEYFESVFYHKPTMEQLDIFHKYLDVLHNLQRQIQLFHLH